jgi:membrane-associated phospholipid phosphatase
VLGRLQNLQSVRPASAAGFPRRWNVELGARARRNFAVTTIGTTVLTGLFFIGYFYVQRHPAHTPTIMPMTKLDLMIPFQPQALPAYVSLWIYIGVGPGLQRTYAALSVYVLWIAGLCVGGLIIFHFWPTQVPRLALSATSYSGFAVLQRMDEASNACPSMHVAVATFTAVRVDELLRSTGSPRLLRLLNAAWFILIAYSTLAIKQHVTLDVAAGALLGMMFVFPSLRWRPAE